MVFYYLSFYFCLNIYLDCVGIFLVYLVCLSTGHFFILCISKTFGTTMSVGFFFFNDFVLWLTIKWSQICILTLFFLHKNQQNWLETECYFSGMTRPKNVSILFLVDISNEFYVKYLLSALVFKLCHMQSFTLLHLLHNRWRKMLLCIVF